MKNWKIGFKMITLKIEGLDKLLTNFDTFVKYNNVATRRALNRIGTQARNVSLRDVKAKGKWNINMKTLKDLSKPIRATNNRPIYSFKMASSSIQLHKWKGTSYSASRTNKGYKRNAKRVGVRYRLKLDKPKRTLAKSFMKQSLFGAKEDIVFTRRKSPKGASITAQASITPTSMFQTDGEKLFIDTFLDKFPERYIQELKYLNVF